MTSTVEFINKEISLVFDSGSSGVQILGPDPNNKAEFSVSFDEPLTLPAHGIDCTLSTDEVIVTNNNPNITEPSDFTYNGITYTIPIGLWSVSELEDEMNFLIAPLPVPIVEDTHVTLTGVQALGKVRIYNELGLDFPGGSSNQLVTLLGLAVGQLPIPAGTTILGDNIARFDVQDSYVVATDLVSNGIRFNNDYAQVISVVHITTGAGGLIVFTPVQPAIIPTPELLGITKSRIEMRLLNNDLSPVDTRQTDWSVRVRIKWKEVRRLDILNMQPSVHHS
jgi:hypothetical protein